MLHERIKLSIVVPSYGREGVLVDTLDALSKLREPNIEIVLIDQTISHEPNVHSRLADWHSRSVIRWVSQSEPSIPAAMNRGALEAHGEILLYLDDDIVPDSHLLSTHVEAHGRSDGDIIAGRVLQPWHEDDHHSDPFTKRIPEVKNGFMGGNFSISRALLLELGGFDENFRGAAYHFECEFADRLLQSGHTIWYEPAALIRHLHHSTGGTRSKGHHLTSWNPRHPVGAYYYLFVSGRVKWRAAKALQRLFRSVMTRHHLKAPWYIPVTLVSEASGLCWALWLRFKGPALPFAAAINERPMA